MPEIISNTSPLLYLYRIGALEWLYKLSSNDFSSKFNAIVVGVIILFNRLSSSQLAFQRLSNHDAQKLSQQQAFPADHRFQ